jgi:hypothetical protein
VNNSPRAGRVGLLVLSSAAASIALLSGCGSADQGTETSVPATTPAGSTPASTSPPSVGASTSVAPSTTGQAPASNAPTTKSEEGGPSQTVSGGNSASQTTVRTPSPPTGDSLPGDNAPPQGNPGSPGRN